MAKKNPTPDKAIDECFESLKAGARPRGVHLAGLEALRKQHSPIFEHELKKPGADWDRDKKMVKRMSEYIGIFARFFAETDGSKEVRWEHLEPARDIVASACPALLKTIATRANKVGRSLPHIMFKYCPGPSVVSGGRRAR